ncbi:glycosidase [Sphingomonas sp. CARO-RG-8B-R24-01]|uniref:glycoside hydrolase family 130 protein n=1 Tax=Sphingomonas sp. CARO-RG-8B-R24-01 TaxID=2914831 RepID=UPI001F567608|nr:glycosidase [Sphingomonas sp. CARO-RG-8B-R24-01]
MIGSKPAMPASTAGATNQSEIAPGVPIVRSRLPADSVTGDRKVLVYPSSNVVDFNVQELQEIHLMGPAPLMARDLMSPYVWLEPDGRFGIMVRAVTQPGEPMTDTGIIWAGWSDDGVHFAMLDQPAIVPGGPGEKDAGGVEDPTVVKMEDGNYVVYYTGVEADMAHGEMFYAAGPTIDALVKTGVALASTKSLGNTKEATVDREKDGRWSLFYEYAADEASRVGLAIGPKVDGPWDEQPTPFMPREDGWDNWHLSTGPMLLDDPEMPVMFYNGATHDARWRIGWVAFDRELTRVVDRCIEPLITPPPARDRTASDIAFSASVTSRDGEVWLYYSLEDRRLSRARLKRS